jgi:carbonic anhydrase/acetyltransferase-like protein (isoleucine patch superfamily)
MSDPTWESVIEEGGVLRLPAEALAKLGWRPGTPLRIERRDGTLLIAPADAARAATSNAPQETSTQEPGTRIPPAPTAPLPGAAADPLEAAAALPTLKEQARQLADAMRNLADTREVRSVLSSIGLGPRAAVSAPGSAAEPASTLGSAAPHGTVNPAAGAVPPTPATPAPPVGAPNPISGAGPLRELDGIAPSVAPNAYVADSAIVIGDVVLGEECTVWPNAVIRGDVNRIRIGARTNVQDGAVIHADPGEFATSIGAGVTIGHGAVVHGCTVADDVLIGIHATVLNGTRIGPRTIVGAGAVVPPGTDIPGGKLAVGVPARVIRDLTPEEIQSILRNADAYTGLRRRYHPDPPRTAPALKAELPLYRCRRATAPVHVDGALDEAAWSAAAPFPPFRRAQDGAEPRFPTELRLCWDDRFLYAAFSCKDTDIRGTMTQHDDAIYNEEVVELFLCPNGDLRHYFELEISPLNVLFDAKVFNPEGDRRTMLVQTEWHAPGIQTAVGVSGTIENPADVDVGWIVEIALPFADVGLPGPPSPGTQWRANFYRIERGEVEEYTGWSPTLKDPADFHVPARFGMIEFVTD